ncbi:DUF1385 domain-containing protein [Dehalogenimonas alkenigignens]|uniref:Putative metal-dependent enzyme n=1 Tax=Dehalogenimonas alkenigignens TaxID=1217799 RepID=A0A0W0GGV2_9CHLR|nr:DUF1385 domain-containing protein [Dehalogenimonas alkenigignens]KTB47782.1 putative metal-dependent enzyme [Dehalogenimonas alkenigignens]PVV83959.1 DUF1385 domain-containing protein [Dehalogenimonas alkenigignens]
MRQKFYYGGQAIIEGVMIRGQKSLVTAVRRPKGEILVEARPLPKIYTGRLRQLPFFRGVIVLLEAMLLGVQALMRSADVALEEETEEVSPWVMWGMVGFSLALSVAIFFLTPLFLASLLGDLLGSGFLFALIEGLIRLALFIAYLAAIGRMPDIRRVFAYHGAEHQTINAYEHGVKLEPLAVREFSTAHTRCGTAFLLAVMVIAILIFSLLGKPALWLMVASRILLLPAIAGLSYEFTRYAAGHGGNALVQALAKPGLWLQAMTTRQPELAQIEVGIAALKKALVDDHPELEAELYPAPATVPVEVPAEPAPAAGPEALT